MNRAPASCKKGPSVLRVEWERDFSFELVPYCIVPASEGYIVFWKPYGVKLGSFEVGSKTEALLTLKAWADRQGKTLVEL